MNARIFIIIVLVLLGLCSVASAKTIYVPDDYARIQWAVDNASAGDTIIVRDGTYVENIDINKQLTIKSENGSSNCIVQAKNSEDHVFYVTADNVTIKGFTVTGSGKAGIFLYKSNNSRIENVNASNNWYCGIHLDYSSNNTITGNTVLYNKFGICFCKSSNNIIANDTVSSNNYDGIHLSFSRNNIIANNNASNNYYGVSLYESSNNTIVNNIASSNNCDGIILSCSSNNTIANNNVSSNNDYGIYLYNSSRNTITGNTVLYNKFGIYFWKSSNNIIANDTVSSNNESGVYLRSSRSNAIANNNISSNNKDGIFLYESSNNNTITNNTISNNSIGIYLLSSSSNTIANNNISSNNWDGIYLCFSNNNIVNNTISWNNRDGIFIGSSDNNTIVNNIISSNNDDGIGLYYSSNNTIANNNVSSNNDYGIYLYNSSRNIVTNNTVSNNWYGIFLYKSSNNNTIYLNNFINNTNQVHSCGSTNIWNSTEKITYTYNGKQYTNYLGNYWSDYTGSDEDGDGIGDTPYSIDSDKDNYPLMQPWENYFAPQVFSADEYFPRITGYEMVYRWNNTIYHPNIITETCVFSNPNTINCSWSLDYESAEGTFNLMKTSEYIRWTGYSTAGTDPFPLPMYMFFYYAYMPNNFLKNNFSVGDSWSGSGTFVGTEDYSATTYVIGIEEISVPAGTFSCIKLKTEFNSSNDYLNGTRYMWLAKDVGIVKLVYQHSDGSVTYGELEEYGKVSNQQPIANFTYSPEKPVVNQSVTFDASSSYDPDGFIVSYEWEFGDGNVTITDNPIITHSYSSAGTYTVNLTVTDNDGLKASISRQLTVSPTTPIPAITSCDAQGNEKNQFMPGENVYVKGCGLEPNTQYKIWIQDDPVELGDELIAEEDPSGYQELITTNETGCFDPTLIWSIDINATPTFNKYDIVIDKVDGNTGVFDSADGIDDAVVAGFVAPIPELATVALICAGVALIIGLRFRF